MGISTFIYLIVCLALGYLAGYLNGTKKDFKEFVDETGQTIRIEAKKLYTPTIPTGRIRPKNAEDVFKYKLNPERREALEETKRTLDSIPELVQAKELLQSMKKTI